MDANEGLIIINSVMNHNMMPTRPVFVDNSVMHANEGVVDSVIDANEGGSASSALAGVRVAALGCLHRCLLRKGLRHVV